MLLTINSLIMKKLLLLLVLMVAGLATMAQENSTWDQQGEMVRDKYNLCFEQGGENPVIPDSELLQLLGEEGYDSYCSGRRLYKTGNGLKNGGWAAFGGGLGLFITGYACVAYEVSHHGHQGLIIVAEVLMLTGIASSLAGNILIPTGYVLRGVGAGKISRMAEGYNSNHSKTAFSYSLSPSVMSVNMPQSQGNVALGMTFSINF